MFLRLSVCPHGIIRLLLDELLLNLIFEHFFRKSVKKIQISLKSDNNYVHFAWRPIYIFGHISLISSYNDKCFQKTKIVEKIKTHNLLSATFGEYRTVYEIMWKNTVQPDRPQMTIGRMRIASWILEARDTHSEYVLLIAFLGNNV